MAQLPSGDRRGSPFLDHILVHGGHGYASGLLNLLEAQALAAQAPDFGHFGGRKLGTSRFLCTARLPGLNALGEAHPLLLGDRGQDGDDGLLEQARAVEVLLRKGFELHASHLQALEVVQRLPTPSRLKRSKLQNNTTSKRR